MKKTVLAVLCFGLGIALILPLVVWVKQETRGTDGVANSIPIQDGQDTEQVGTESGNNETKTDNQITLNDSRDLDWLKGVPFKDLYFHENSLLRNVGLYTLLADVDLAGLKALLNETEVLDPDPPEAGAFNILILRYAELDPVGAFEYLESRGEKILYHQSLRLFHVWAKNDLAAAVRFAETQPHPLRHGLARSILWARDDLSRSELSSIALRLGSDITLQGILATREQRDPALQHAALLTFLLQGEFEHEIKDDASRIVRNWASTNPIDAFHFVDASFQFRAHRTELLGIAAAEIAKTDTRSAWNMAVNASLVDRKKLVGRVLQVWDVETIAEAFELVGSLDDTRLKTGALRQLLERIDEIPQEDAINLLSSLTMENDFVRREVVGSWGTIAPRQALKLLDSFDSRDEALKASAGVIRDWAANDLPGCLEWFEKEASNDVRAVVANDVTFRYAKSDPWQALAWARTQGEVTGKNYLEEYVMQTIAHSDPDVAMELLDDIVQHGGTGERAFYIGMELIQRQRYSDAFELANRIPQERVRERYLEKIFNSGASIRKKDIPEFASLDERYHDSVISSLIRGFRVVEGDESAFVELVHDQDTRNELTKLVESPKYAERRLRNFNLYRSLLQR